jgi:SAM-dependent methyltransferase
VPVPRAYTFQSLRVWQQTCYLVVQEKSDVRQARLAITESVSLPLREGFGSVDSVSCLRQLDQCDSPEVLVAEIARVLRPGGLLLLTVPNGNVESLLRPWFQVEMQQALDSPEQRLLICTRNKRLP